MAQIPNATEEIIDPGLGFGSDVSAVPVFMGVTSIGTANTFKTYNSPTKLKQELGEGPAVEDALAVLSLVGGPVGFVKVTGGVAASNGAVSQSGAGPLITLSGSSVLDAYCRVEIVKGGALGAGEFRYCLDGYSGDSQSERTYSENLVIPAGGVFAIPVLGVTVTFPSGTYVLGETYTFSVQCAGFNSTNLNSAFSPLASTPISWRSVFVITSENCGDAVAHATLATALQTNLDALITSGLYKSGMIMASMDLSENESDVFSAWSGVVANRLCVTYGTHRRSSLNSFIGHASPRRPHISAFSIRASGSLLSTDLKRVQGNGLKDGGPLPGILKLFNNEHTDATGLDDIKISTLRSYPNRPGFYITQARIKSAAGSDFRHWHLRNIMDTACEIIHDLHVQMIGSGVRTNSDGTIDERDAIRWEEIGQARLENTLLNPTNAEGTKGHVSSLAYRIDRTQNVLATETIVGDVVSRPNGTISDVHFRVGYSAQIPGEEVAAAAQA